MGEVFELPTPSLSSSLLSWWPASVTVDMFKFNIPVLYPYKFLKLFNVCKNDQLMFYVNYKYCFKVQLKVSPLFALLKQIKLKITRKIENMILALRFT